MRSIQVPNPNVVNPVQYVQPVQHVQYQPQQPQYVQQMIPPQNTKYCCLNGNDVMFFYTWNGNDVRQDPETYLIHSYDTWKKNLTRHGQVVGDLRTLSPEQITKLQNPINVDTVIKKLLDKERQYERAGPQSQSFFADDITYQKSAFFCFDSTWYGNRGDNEKKEIQMKFLKSWVGLSILVIALIALIEGIRYDWTDHASFEVALGVIIFIFVLFLGYQFTRSSTKQEKNRIALNDYRNTQQQNESIVQMPMLDLIALQPQLQNGFDEKQALLLNSA